MGIQVDRKPDARVTKIARMGRRRKNSGKEYSHKKGGSPMEGFSYVDIFATKHIEYLLVIGFLLLFIPFWRLLNRPAKTVFEAAERLVPIMSDWFRLPEERYYHWALPEGNNVVKVGLNDFAQKLVGKIDAIRVPTLGSTINQGDKGWTLEADSKAVDMLSPVDGKVIAINEELVRSPKNINKDPYNSWLMKVRPEAFTTGSPM